MWFPFCCEACYVRRPSLVTVIMQEGVAHPTAAMEVPYKFNLEWLKPEGSGPDIKLSVEMEEDGLNGMLIFKGSGFTKFFKISRQTTGKTLTISNNRDSYSFQSIHWALGNPNRRLESVDVKAEMAFPEPQNRICSNPNPWNNSDGPDPEDFSDGESFDSTDSD